ncbi:MAG: hypothetical protein ACT4PL_05640, partial [Phycisphaerales bacterium]
MALAALMLAQNLITRTQFDQALTEQRATGDRLDRVLLKLNLIDRDGLLRLASREFAMPLVDLEAYAVQPEALAALSPKLVHARTCVPLSLINGTLTVATSDPFDGALTDDLRMATGRAIDLVLADEEDLRQFIRTHYGVGSATLDELSAGLPEEAQAVA